MNEVHARPPPPPPSSPITVGKGSASFFGQRVAVYAALVTLHVKMEARQNSDSDQFSYGDFFNAPTDEDLDLLQLTEEERAELVAVVNQEGNDTAHTTGKSIFHVYFVHLKTNYVDGASAFGSNCDGFEKLFLHTLQRGYTVNTHTNFKAIFGVVIPTPPSNLANIPVL